MKRPYRLPNMTQLASFEATARRLSFKDAAEELDVTASAISHQIRALEDDLSCMLFHRHGRSVELTEIGEQLFKDTKENFENLNIAVTKLRNKAEKNVISISTTSTFSSLWLAPRIRQFLSDHPEYRVNQMLRDNSSKDNGDPELIVEYGKTDMKGLEATKLFRDELVPVASPDFASRYRSLNLPSLARMPLIKLDSKEAHWTSWQEWFRELGYLGDINYSQKANNYLVALQIAKEGGGVVLGWRHMVAPMLAKKELAVMSNFSMPAEQPYYLMCKGSKNLSPATSKFKEWLLKSKNSQMSFFSID